MDIPKPTVIYYRESLLQSVIADIFTFGTMVGLFFANRYYFGNTAWFGAILTIMAILYLGSKRSKQYFNTFDEAITYLQEEKQNKINK